MDEQENNLKRRLQSRKFIEKHAVAALKGLEVPHHLGRELTRLCVVRGIRFSPDYCFGPAAALRGLLPIFTRALNARAIMSDRVPDMDPENPQDIPYCIWFPDHPSQDTLRELVRRYPDMAYQAARACAVAGHTELYKELAGQILPEVAIAEEARDNGNLAIFDLIMEAPCRYKVFDDYNRAINTAAPRVAFLNGDTATREYLMETQPFQRPIGRMDDEEGDSEPDDDEEDIWTLGPSPGFDDTIFNITEYMNISLDGSICGGGPHIDDETIRLLSQPLPADLTTCNKDLLILMAAYNGDIDRYHRLRRPKFIDREINCVIRGIYHNTTFAQWWKGQAHSSGYELSIRMAISARGIMDNDLSYILSPEGRIPDQIWYPAVAASATYEALARLVPDMRPSVTRAAIFANYQTLFDSLLAGDDGHMPVAPSRELLCEAKHSHNTHYREALERKAVESGLDITSKNGKWQYPMAQDVQRYTWSFNCTKPERRPGILADRRGPDSIYSGWTCDASEVEAYISIPEQWRKAPEGYSPAADEDDWLDLDYKQWPPEKLSKRY